MKTKYFILLMFLILQEDVFSQAVGTPFTPFLIPKGLVVSRTGRIWMDKNLGAKRVATSPEDSLAFGFYYQWGRGSDGHQERLSIPYNFNQRFFMSNVWRDSNFPFTEASSELIVNNNVPNQIASFNRNNLASNSLYISQSQTDIPNHNYFIHIKFENDLASEFSTTNPNNTWVDGGLDWRYPSNDSLWQGINGINNPCPPKFRVPTSSEWNEEASTWTQDAGYIPGFSPLKLTIQSYRFGKEGYFMYFNGFNRVFNGQASGEYWTSTIKNWQYNYRVNGVNKSKTIHDTFYFSWNYYWDDYADVPVNVTNGSANSSSERSVGRPVRCILDQSYSIRDLTLGDYSIYSDYSYWHP